MFLLLSYLVIVNAIKISDIPNPTKNPIACGRMNPSRICDSSLYLSSTIKDTFDLNAFKIGGQFPCKTNGKPVEIASLWIKNMDKNNGESTNDAAKRYAMTVQNNWGVGDSICNNGLLLFVSIDDRAFYISVGEGLAKNMTSSNTNSVFDAMRPYMRNLNYDAALMTGLNKINDTLSSEAGIQLDGWAIFGITAGVMVYMSICLFMVLWIKRKEYEKEEKRLLETRNKYKYHNEQRNTYNRNTYNRTNFYDKPQVNIEEINLNKKKTKIRDLINKAKQTKDGYFSQTDCPICLEKFIDGMETIELNCKHKFCEKCLQTWYEKNPNPSQDNNDDMKSAESEEKANKNEKTEKVNVSCPICRRISHFENTSKEKDEDKKKKRAIISAETDFRLNSLSTQHTDLMPMYKLDDWIPTVLTIAAINEISHHNHYDYSSNYNTHHNTSYTSSYDSTPTYTSNYDSTPTYTSSYDFGGGSSFDYGGGGGGW